MLRIKVGVMPGKVEEYVVENGATVANAITVAGLSSEGYEVMVNGYPAVFEKEIADNSYVTLTAKIKGNN